MRPPVRSLPLFALLFVACGPPAPSGELPRLPHLSSAPLANERSIQLQHAYEVQRERSPNIASQLKSLVKDGFGATAFGAGLALETRTLDGAPPPAPGPNRKLLGRFVHLADAQLADDESPSRLAAFDTIGPTGAAYRPQEAWGCHILDAAVRTINRIHEELPLDCVILGGDNIDSNQRNEVAWFNAVLDGAEKVECDSGQDDDPVLGPFNDPKDPFFAEGLHVPWRWVNGNHDVLNQGNFAPTPELNAVSIGTDAQTGTRDWSKPWGPLTTGQVPADGQRELLTRPALAEAAAQGGDGHGLAAPSAITDGRLFYRIEFPGRPLEVIVIDTGAELGGAQGVLRNVDVQARAKPLIEAAEAAGKWVIVTGHHPAHSLGDGTGLGGAQVSDAITPDAWRAFLGQHPRVILHLSGHTHRFRTQLEAPAGGHKYWATETSALSDWPSQMRLFEIWDEDNGALRIRAIPIDYADDDDPFAREGRLRAAVDFTAGWTDGDLNESGALELWFPKP
jgi:hypothetical protein